MTDHRDYLLGTDAAEELRLGTQHRLWAESAVAIWERAGIRVGSRVLDLGSGPGFAALDIAQLVGPEGRVLGIEGNEGFAQSFRRRAEALGTPWAKVITGDLHELSNLLESEHEPFDVAYSRWVPCFLADPASVVRQAAEALKPGGRLAIQDYFGYTGMCLAPRRPIFERIVQAMGELWNETGNLDVMGDMPRFIRNAGLEMIDFRMVHRIARPSDPIWDWPSIFWPNFLPRVVEAGRLSQAEMDEFMAVWTEASQDPDTFMMLPPVFEAVAIKPE
ncbi:MAG TPA: methyltransferase domain-containing protein [Phycisphaerales bacterium]|nr:methyltransferase domain-containing protein [Phycisphaerales bacterium]